MTGKLSLMLAAIVFVSGCSSMGAKKSDEEIVAQRGQEWMDALVKNDFEKAWSYTTPAFRGNNPTSAYVRRMGGAANWTDGRFKSAACDMDRCEVKFLIDYSLPRFSVKNTRVIENVWIKVDGKWWIYQK